MNTQALNKRMKRAQPVTIRQDVMLRSLHFEDNEYGQFRTDQLNEAQAQQTVRDVVHTLRQTLLRMPVESLALPSHAEEFLLKHNYETIERFVRAYRNGRFDKEPKLRTIDLHAFDQAYAWLMSHGIVGGYHVPEV